MKLGLTDGVSPETLRNPIVPGTDTRNDYTNWNVSTEINK